MKKRDSIIILCLVFVGVGMGIYYTRATPPAESATLPVSNPPEGGGDISAINFTLADVASHNTRQSCYAAINGSVYDLTSFIYQHPGGSARILQICGTEATAAFSAQHGTDSRAQRELNQLKIGTVIP